MKLKFVHQLCPSAEAQVVGNQVARNHAVLCLLVKSLNVRVIHIGIQADIEPRIRSVSDVELAARFVVSVEVDRLGVGHHATPQVVVGHVTHLVDGIDGVVEIALDIHRA